MRSSYRREDGTNSVMAIALGSRREGVVSRRADNAEFEAFVAEHGAALLRHAVVLTGNHASAEDLLQSVLCKAFLKWARVRGADHPRAYVLRMLINEHLSAQRRRSATELPVEFVATEVATYERGFQLAEEVDEARRLLNSLGVRTRTVIVLKFFADMDDRAIAEYMGISESAVRATVSRTLRQLRSRTEWQAVQ